MKAKLRVSKITEHAWGSEVLLSPIYHETENKQLWGLTTAGEVHLVVSKEAAEQYFETGHEYFMTFTPA